MESKKILFISVIDLWGNDEVPLRAPGKTISHYINNEYDIFICGIAKNNLKYKRYDNVKFVGQIPSLDVKSNKFVRYILINFISVPILLIYSLIIANFFKVSLIYGYEVHGVLAGKAVSLASRGRLVSRFQGSVLYDVLRNGSRLRKATLFAHFLAFKLKCHKAIITDDGTKANVVFRKLNKSEYIFLKNGVNTPANLLTIREMRKTLNKALPDTYICVSSRLVSWKKVERSIEVMSKLTEEISVPTLVIVGDGPRRQDLQILADQRHVTTLFLGHVDQELSYNLIKNCKIFLSFYELSNVGNPLLEALQCHKPVVTIANGDTPKVITNNVNGITIQRWSLHEATECVRLLLQNDKLCKKLSAGAKDYSDRHLRSWNDRLRTEENFIFE